MTEGMMKFRILVSLVEGEGGGGCIRSKRFRVTIRYSCTFYQERVSPVSGGHQTAFVRVLLAQIEPRTIDNYLNETRETEKKYLFPTFPLFRNIR